MGDRVDTFFKELGGFPRALPPKPKRRTLRPVGRKGRERRTAWAVVAAQLPDRCEACDVHYLPECNGRYEHPHHILPRGRGGRDVRSNALAVSWAHHRWIHDNDAAAAEVGLLRETELTPCISCGRLLQVGADAHDPDGVVYCPTCCPECR